MFRLARKQLEYQANQSQLSEIAETKHRFDVEVSNLRNYKRDISRKLEHLKATKVRLRLKQEELTEVVQGKIDPVDEEAKAMLGIEVYLNSIDSYSHSFYYVCSLSPPSFHPLSMERDSLPGERDGDTYF